VPAHRGNLVAAALTIPLAYMESGQSRLQLGLKPFGRFDDWSRWCREPLVWLGWPDPCSSRRTIEDRDPLREGLRTLLSAWHSALGGAPYTIANVLKCVEENFVEGLSSELVANLRQAIEAVAAEGRVVNRERLGKFIRRHERRIEGGLQFQRAGDRQNVALWRVMQG
jgi:hypothetical protein